jgi:hypothetical protein
MMRTLAIFFCATLCVGQITPTDSQVTAIAGNLTAIITASGGVFSAKGSIENVWIPAGFTPGADRSITYTTDGNMINPQLSNINGTVFWSLTIQPNGGDVIRANGQFATIAAVQTGFVAYLIDLEANRPAVCPGPGMVFFSASDTGHLFWCHPAIPVGATDSTPWTRILQDVKAAPVAAPGIPIIGAIQEDGTCSPVLPGFAPSFTSPTMDVLQTTHQPGAMLIQNPWIPCVVN